MSDASAIYKHRQPGYVIMIVTAAIFIYSSEYVINGRYSSLEFIIILATILVCLIFFFSQTVEISHDTVKISMGIGIIKKRIDLNSITGSKVVKNRWYTGWGIRFIPRGMMFNVSGLYAVELELASGNVFRIGTDDPDNLNSIIQNSIKFKK